VSFCLVFERELLSVPVMRQVLGDTLRGVAVDEDSIADILLAATEACSNVVLHAGPSVRAYTVALTVDGAVCQVEVTDVGRGLRMPPAAPSHTASPDHTANRGSTGSRGGTGSRGSTGSAASPAHPGVLAESGRGLSIMRACMDVVTVRSAPGRGTRVVLGKRVRWAEQLARTA
jgi:serine/threonine-protein kinase RsbW